MKKRVTISMEKLEALIRVETEAREVVAMDPGKHRRLQILALRQALTELHEIRVEEHWPIGLVPRSPELDAALDEICGEGTAEILSILPTPKEDA